METTIQSSPEIAQTIIKQLGGSRFKAMTGSKNFLYADIIELNPIFWLRMDLIRNKSGVNKLKIFLNSDDTYTMKFYKQTMTKDFEVKISKEQEFVMVYCDQLKEIFTTVTGLRISL
jgi:hypothetical protein